MTSVTAKATICYIESMPEELLDYTFKILLQSELAIADYNEESHHRFDWQHPSCFDDAENEGGEHARDGRRFARHRSALALSRTCKRFCRIVQPLLFANIKLTVLSRDEDFMNGVIGHYSQLRDILLGSKLHTSYLRKLALPARLYLELAQATSTPNNHIIHDLLAANLRTLDVQGVIDDFSIGGGTEFDFQSPDTAEWVQLLRKANIKALHLKAYPWEDGMWDIPKALNVSIGKLRCLTSLRLGSMHLDHFANILGCLSLLRQLKFDMWLSTYEQDIDGSPPQGFERSSGVTDLSIRFAASPIAVRNFMAWFAALDSVSIEPFWECNEERVQGWTPSNSKAAVLGHAHSLRKLRIAHIDEDWAGFDAGFPEFSRLEEFSTFPQGRAYFFKSSTSPRAAYNAWIKSTPQLRKITFELVAKMWESWSFWSLRSRPMEWIVEFGRIAAEGKDLWGSNLTEFELVHKRPWGRWLCDRCKHTDHADETSRYHIDNYHTDGMYMMRKSYRKLSPRCQYFHPANLLSKAKRALEKQGFKVTIEHHGLPKLPYQHESHISSDSVRPLGEAPEVPSDAEGHALASDEESQWDSQFDGPYGNPESSPETSDSEED